MERVREQQQQQQHQQQQQQLRRVLRRSEVTARRDNARRADVDRSALQYAMASSLRQLLPEQRLECLELAQVMAASKREDEEQRAGCRCRRGARRDASHRHLQHLPAPAVEQAARRPDRHGCRLHAAQRILAIRQPRRGPILSRRAMAVLFLNAMAMVSRCGPPDLFITIT